MTQLTLGPVSFKTKQAATIDIRRILHSAVLGEYLSGRDLAIVSALYERHPRRNGTPQAFCVGINDYHGSLSRGFQAIFADGSRKPFSYIPCLSPTLDAPSIVKVMRAAIMLAQREALHSHFQGKVFVRCALSCSPSCIANVQLHEAHVHHLHPKFRDIADHFISLVGIPEIQTGRLGDDFVDVRMRRRWITFHESVAQRVVVCPACNAEDERT